MKCIRIETYQSHGTRRGWRQMAWALAANSARRRGARSLLYSPAFMLVGAMLAAPALVLAEKPASVGSDRAQRSAQEVQGATAKHAGKAQGQGQGKGQSPGSSMHDDIVEGREDSQRSMHDVDRGSRARGEGMPRLGTHFDEVRQASVRDYYAEQIRTGRCPPGLAKKNNGCMPPGQAKKWSIGQKLPGNVIFHNLPPQILGYLGTVPKDQRFVRVDNDILLISRLTGLVIDAIPSLGE